MKTELFYLALTAVFTGLLWIPYVLDRFAVRGIGDTVGYPDNPKPQHPWAQRLMKAHVNAVENLVVFATLVLVASALGFQEASWRPRRCSTSGLASRTPWFMRSGCPGCARSRSRRVHRADVGGGDDPDAIDQR
jgi:hypothetical protein